MSHLTQHVLNIWPIRLTPPGPTIGSAALTVCFAISSSMLAIDKPPPVFWFKCSTLAAVASLAMINESVVAIRTLFADQMRLQQLQSCFTVRTIVKAPFDSARNCLSGIHWTDIKCASALQARLRKPLHAFL